MKYSVVRRKACLGALGILTGILLGATDNVMQESFSDDSRIKFNLAFGKFAGSNAFEVDTTGVSDPWNRICYTLKGSLKPNTDYVAAFRYRVEIPAPSKRYFHVLCRPLGASGNKLDTMTRNLGEHENFTDVKLKFRTGDRPDYAFCIYTYGKLRGAVGDFRLTEGTGEEFFPVSVSTTPYTGEFGKVPTGAKEFEVEHPDNPEGAVVKAADFGFSETADDNTEALNRALEFCKKNGAAKLELAPGTYRMTANRSILLDNMRDFEFDGKGATLVFNTKCQWTFDVTNCERVVMRNFNYEWDWEKDPLASVVKVVKTDPAYVDFEFIEYENFPRRDLRITVLSSYDPATKSVGIENGFTRYFQFWLRDPKPKTEWLSGNTLRVYTVPEKFAPGQLFRMQHYYYDVHGIHMLSNRHFTVEDVNIYSCAGHAFFMDGVQQYTHFRRVRVAPPENAPRRPISCSADHLHIARSRGFLKIEECEFSFGGDDCINVHDCASYGKKVASNRIRTDRFFYLWSCKRGDEVELRHSNYSTAIPRTKIKDLRSVDQSKGICEIDFEDPVPEPLAPGEGFVMFNWTYDSRNIIIRDSSFHNNRARGLLLLGRDITLENNRFFHNEMGALRIETGYSSAWSEGYGVSNLVIRNNRFDTTNPIGVASDGKAHDVLIRVYRGADDSLGRVGAPVLSDILFEDNTFKDSFGLVAFISSAENVIFRNNTFANPTGRRMPSPYRGLFFVANTNDVKIVNNRWIASPYVNTPGVFADSGSVKGLLVSGNVIVPPKP